MFTVLLAFNFEFGRVRQAVAGRSSGRARLEMEGATRRRRGRRRGRGRTSSPAYVGRGRTGAPPRANSIEDRDPVIAPVILRGVEWQPPRQVSIARFSFSPSRVNG